MICRIRESFHPEELRQVVHLINLAYDLTEGLMFEPGYERTSEREISHLAAKGQLLVAEQEGEIWGVVKVGQKGNRTATFGMLSVQEKHWGKKIGKALVQACERWAHDHCCTHLEIEILRSHEISMPHKDRLYTWYEKMGYLFQGEIAVEEMYPAIVPQIIHKGVIQIFRKELLPLSTAQRNG